MKAKSESEVTQSCQTLSDPMDRSPPGFSVHGIFQARVLEWGAIAFSIYIYIYMTLNIYYTEQTSPYLNHIFLCIRIIWDAEIKRYKDSIFYSEKIMPIFLNSRMFNYQTHSKPVLIYD